MEAVDTPRPKRVLRAAAGWIRLPALALALAACATVPDARRDDALRAALGAALDLFEAGEFPLAAERFAQVERRAASGRERELQRKALVGECLSWLHAQRLQALADCSERLERSQRRARRPDPAVNTLVALGAVAGGRPLPALRVPGSVRPLVQAAAQEGS